MVAQDLAIAPLFRVGSVVGTAFKVWLKNIVFFGVLGLIAYLPGLIIQLSSGAPADGAQQVDWTKIWVGICNLILVQMLVAIVSHGVYQQLRNRSIDIGMSISIGLQRFLPALVASILAFILIAVGFVLLVIPGFMASIALWVTLPACVAEGLGPIASMKRSAELTKGYRWAIFGAYLLFLVIMVVASLVVGIVAGLVIASSAPGNLHPAVDLLGYVVSSLVASLTAVVAATTYYQLRAVKEGVDIGQLASVFD